MAKPAGNDRIDHLCFAGGAVLLVGAVIGGFMHFYEAGVDKGRLKQFALDQERAKEKGFEL